MIKQILLEILGERSFSDLSRVEIAFIEDMVSQMVRMNSITDPEPIIREHLRGIHGRTEPFYAYHHLMSVAPIMYARCSSKYVFVTHIRYKGKSWQCTKDVLLMNRVEDLILLKQTRYKEGSVYIRLSKSIEIEVHFMDLPANMKARFADLDKAYLDKLPIAA